MAKKFIQPGEVIDYTAGSALSSGAVVLIGNRIGVLLTDLASGEVGAAQVTGVWEPCEALHRRGDAGRSAVLGRRQLAPHDDRVDAQARRVRMGSRERHRHDRANQNQRVTACRSRRLRSLSTRR